MNFFRNKKNQQGFTIVEVLVSTFVFSIIMVGVGAIFVQILILQRRGSGAQKVQENMLFTLELMAREIRVSKIENQDSPNCDRTMLTILHPVNGTVTYTLANGAITRSVGLGAPPGPMTSTEVDIQRLNFCVMGTTVTGGVGDRKQARVATILQVKSKTNRAEDSVTFDIQTSVVSRDNVTEFTSF